MIERVRIVIAATIAAALAAVLFFTTGDLRLHAVSLCAAVLTAAAASIRRITSDNRPGPVASGESSVFASATLFSVFTSGSFLPAVPIHLIAAPLLTSRKRSERKSVFTGAVIASAAVAVIVTFNCLSAIDVNALLRILSGTGNRVTWRFVLVLSSVTATVIITIFALGRCITLRGAALNSHPFKRRVTLIVFINFFRAAATIPLFILSGLSAIAPFPEKERGTTGYTMMFFFSLVHYELFHLAVARNLEIPFCAYTVALGFILHLIDTRTEDRHDRSVR